MTQAARIAAMSFQEVRLLALEELDHRGAAPSSGTLLAGGLFDARPSLSTVSGGWTALILAVALNAGVFALVLMLPADRAFGEQGLLEVLQVVMLLSIAAILALALVHRATMLRPILIVLLMMAIAFAMREGDLRVWDVPAWAKMLGSGSVRNPLTLGFVVVAILLHIPATARQTMWSYISSPYAAPVAICLVLLLCGKVAENLPLGWPATELFEELFEFNAYVFLAAAAAALYRRAREVSEETQNA